MVPKHGPARIAPVNEARAAWFASAPNFQQSGILRQACGPGKQRMSENHVGNRPSVAGGAKVLLADEPTGNLDAVNAARMTTLLWEQAQRAGCALVVATHNEAVAANADQVVSLGIANGDRDEWHGLLDGLLLAGLLVQRPPPQDATNTKAPILANDNHVLLSVGIKAFRTVDGRLSSP